MKSQPTEFLEWVEHDLNYARDFYDSWLPGGADKFLTRFREAVTWIEWNPEQFLKKHRFFRRAIITGLTLAFTLRSNRQSPQSLPYWICETIRV